MATSSTYYIDTDNFSTATAVWVNSGLTTKAPDGYYSFGGNYRQQFNGLLQAIQSCETPPPVSYPFSGIGGSITCTSGEIDIIESGPITLYASTNTITDGTNLYIDANLTILTTIGAFKRAGLIYELNDGNVDIVYTIGSPC